MNGQSETILSLRDTIILTVNTILSTLGNFLPRLILACLVLVIGIVLAGWIKNLVKNIVRAMTRSKVIDKTPLESFFARGDVSVKIEEIVGELFRWVVIYIFLISALSLLGLQTVSQFLTNLLNYIPQVISALIIFGLGVLAAGLVESVVKSAMAAIDVTTGRLMGKIASYTVVVFASLAAISELGIAKFFIYTLFIGFVTMLSLGVGLAVGLGAKDLIADLLSKWRNRQ